MPSDFISKKDLKCFLRTKIGFRRQQGFQPELVCLLYWTQRPPIITNINIYTKSSVILFGTDESIVAMDYANRTLLINMSIVDFYGAQDPFHRITGSSNNKSPKKKGFTNVGETDENHNFASDSPSANQTSGGGAMFSLQKQQTIDQSNSKDGGMSRSSSCSSLENLSQSEGVSCIVVNDYAPTLLRSSKSDFKQQIIQVWLGTTYGSVIVLNLTHSNNSINNNNSNSINSNQLEGVKSGLSDQAPLNLKSISPSGTTYSLKGQVIDVSFIDLNGNLISSSNAAQQQTPNQISDIGLHNHKKDSSSKDEIEEEDLNNLDIELDFLTTNSIISNSIAENFYSSSTTNNNQSENKDSSGNLLGIENDNTNLNSSAPFMSSFSNILNSSNNTFAQSFDETKTSSKQSKSKSILALEFLKSFLFNQFSFLLKESLAATKSAKLEFSTANDQNVVINSDKSQFVVLTSENQIKVIGLPSQATIYKYTLSEGIVAKANVTVVNCNNFFLTFFK